MLKLNTSNQNNASQFFLQKVEECNKQHSKRTISDNFNKFKLKWGFNEIKSLPQSEDVKLCFDSNFSKSLLKKKF